MQPQPHFPDYYQLKEANREKQQKELEEQKQEQEQQMDFNSKDCLVGDTFDHAAIGEIIANWRMKFMKENHVKFGQLIQVG